jgi:hypothetical protein
MDLMLNNTRQSKAFSVLTFAAFAHRDLAIYEAFFRLTRTPIMP